MIVESNSTHWITDTRLVGSNNDIRGSNNTITGDDNMITGSNNNIIGNGNTITGSNNTITGNQNKATGSNNELRGFGNEHSEGSVVSMYDCMMNADSWISTTGNIPIARKTGEKKSPKCIALPKGTDTAMTEDSKGAACVICMERESICALLPCAHRILCVQCSRELANGKTKDSVQCPECRAPVKKIVRIYH
jgi:hypothetical protein